MATRRRIGVSAATTEAARRQLMQPVTCWEKVWQTPENTTNNSSLKVYKWVKTDKLQQFSDDEGEADEPLAPLPDDPEVVDGDEEMDQDESADVPEAEPPRQEVIVQEDGASKAPSPKPQLTMSLQPNTQPPDDLDASLKPLDAGLGDVEGKLDNGDVLELDIGGLGPDGLQLESTGELSQIDQEDVLIGGSIMEHRLDIDPFAE